MGRYFEKYSGGLSPDFKFLSDKAVIVQAWKKAHEYIRRHNWYSESLELDASCIELESFYKEIQRIFSSSVKARKYRPEPMRLVPAPKTAKADQISAFSWRWSEKDEKLVSEYQASINLASTAWKSGQDGIPQGLVAGGFFANVYLLAFDDSIRRLIEKQEMLRVSFRFIESPANDDIKVSENSASWLFWTD